MSQYSIKSAQLYKYRLPYLDATAFAHQQAIPLSNNSNYRQGLIIRLNFHDGSVGLGEAAPLTGFSKESFTDCQKALINFLGNQFKLQEAPYAINNVRRCSSTLAPALANTLPNAAAFAVDCALNKVLPLQTKLNSSSGLAIPNKAQLVKTDTDKTNTDRILLQGNLTQITDRFASLNCPKKIKLKVGTHSPQALADMLAALYDIEPLLSIQLDGNQAWQLQQANDFINALGQKIKNIPSSLIDCFEEPCKVLADSLTFANRHNVKLALDENLRQLANEETLECLLQQNLLITKLIIKPTLNGSLAKSLSLIALAKKYQRAVYLSSSIESPLGLSQLRALANKQVLKENFNLNNKNASHFFHVDETGLDTMHFFATSAIDNQEFINDLCVGKQQSRYLELLWKH